MNDHDYFAAHAPMPIPDWFKGKHASDMPHVPDVPTHWSAQQAAQFSDLRTGIAHIASVGPEVGEFFVTWLAARDKHNAWRERQREAKYFAWRWYYADMMLAGRSRAD